MSQLGTQLLVTIAPILSVCPFHRSRGWNYFGSEGRAGKRCNDEIRRPPPATRWAKLFDRVPIRFIKSLLAWQDMTPMFLTDGPSEVN